LIRRGNISSKVIGFWKNDKFILITSREIIKEIADVLRCPFLVEKYGYDIAKVDTMIDLINQKAIFVDPKFSLTLCRDPNDDKFIDCAILGKVKYLVSEDKDIIDDEKLKKQLFEYTISIKNAFEFYQEIIKEIRS